MKKTEKRERRRREAWQNLVAQWRSSGVRAPEFARLHGLKVANLYYWSSVLGREKAKPCARLVPVQVAPREVRSMGTELAVGTVRVRFEDLPPPSYVAALSKALLEASTR